jgi:hypothetical protein
VEGKDLFRHIDKGEKYSGMTFPDPEGTVTTPLIVLPPQEKRSYFLCGKKTPGSKLNNSRGISGLLFKKKSHNLQPR